MKDLKMKLHRQEYKYYISNEELVFLRNSLKTFMKLDENVNNGENFILLQAYILILRIMIILMKKLMEFIPEKNLESENIVLQIL